jgi:hypothetical protein
MDFIPCELYIRYRRFYYYMNQWVGQYLCRWNIRFRGYNPPSVSVLTWFITYIYYWNLQFSNNVIIIKTKVLLLRTYLTLADVGCDVSGFLFSCLGPLVLLLLKTYKLFGFPIFWFFSLPEKGYSRNALCAIN